MGAISKNKRTINDPETYKKQKMDRLRAAVAICRFSEGEVELAKKEAVELLKDAKDERTRLKASKLLVDVNLKVAELDIEIDKYEAPPTQKIEHSGEQRITIKLDNIDV